MSWIPTDTQGADDAAANALIDCLRKRATRRVSKHGEAVMTWHCFGEGPPVVLLHGGHGSWLHWVRNIETLSARHTLWVADMPGYGQSDLPPGHTRERPLVAPLVERVIASIDLCIGRREPIDLVGFSFGGWVATHVAEVLGDAVRKLVLLGPAGHGGPRRPRGELVNWRFAAHRKDAAALRQAMHDNLAVHMLHSPVSIDALAIAVHTESCMATRFRSRDISRSGGLVEALTARVAGGGDTTVFWGEHDVTADPSWVVENVIPGHVSIVPGVGHWLQYEGAEFTNRRLAALLAY